MRALRILPLLLGLAGACRAAAPLPGDGGPYRNLFHELLGKGDAEIDAKVSAAWSQLFLGAGDTQRLFYPVAGDMAYVPDVANHDVRTEGLSYGMMICVQLDRKTEFDQIWRWAKTNLYHPAGPYSGYFAWHGDFQGRQIDAGPAPDGEEWFTTALFFAAHRWGDGSGMLDYDAQAQAILRAMLHRGEDSGGVGATSMFDAAARQVVFVPGGAGAHFTDPSYHLPFFYELWARWAAAPRDRAFCADAAKASRALFKLAADPTTGLMPDYCGFDGRPIVRRGHEDFRYDAWRTLCYPAMDYSWFNPDPWEVERSNRVLRFLAAQGPSCPDRFKLDGAPVSTDTNSPGLSAMAATAGLAADPDVARPFVGRLWDMEIPSGHFRYYNGLLYMLALLETSGRFRIIGPAPGP
jgi:oligosaccharide reducing-end xylanase